MKKESIGDITRNGGFSRIIREVQDGDEPIAIMRNNKPVAIVMPANSESLHMTEENVNYGRALKEFAKKGLNHELEIYLVSQVLVGLQARTLLGLTLHEEALRGLETSMIEATRRAIVEAVRSSASLKSYEEDSAMLESNMSAS